MLRQNWIAASEKACLRPRFPLGVVCHCISLSSYTVSTPRALSAALHRAYFVRWLAQHFLSSAIRSAYQWGKVDLCSKTLVIVIFI